MTEWYELEIMMLDNAEPSNFYTEQYDRSDENAGYDIFSSMNITVNQKPEFIPFGIVARLLKVAQMPGGTSNDYLKTDSHYWLVPRSSIYKTGLMMANSIGTIDKGYRGELKAPVWSMTGKSEVSRGDRLFQIVAPNMGWIRNVKLVNTMPQTERGSGGFGSTGK